MCNSYTQFGYCEMHHLKKSSDSRYMYTCTSCTVDCHNLNVHNSTWLQVFLSSYRMRSEGPQTCAGARNDTEVLSLRLDGLEWSAPPRKILENCLTSLQRSMLITHWVTDMHRSVDRTNPSAEISCYFCGSSVWLEWQLCAKFKEHVFRMFTLCNCRKQNRCHWFSFLSKIWSVQELSKVRRSHRMSIAKIIRICWLFLKQIMSWKRTLFVDAVPFPVFGCVDRHLTSLSGFVSIVIHILLVLLDNGCDTIPLVSCNPWPLK